MSAKPGDLLLQAGVPEAHVARLLSDDDAILTLGDLSISIDGEIIHCFDHAVPFCDPFIAEDHLDYLARLIAINLSSGGAWDFVPDEPQVVAVMTFEADDELVA